jgi:uncharacterized protein
VTTYFLDTGFLIALESLDDRHHKTAQAFWQDFLLNHSNLISTSYVLDEVVTFFNAHGQHAKAVQIGRLLLTSTLIDLVHVDQTLFLEGWRLLEHHRDKRYSLTDCVSFALMKRRKIKIALAFDKHFTQAGFQIAP